MLLTKELGCLALPAEFHWVSEANLPAKTCLCNSGDEVEDGEKIEEKAVEDSMNTAMPMKAATRTIHRRLAEIFPDLTDKVEFLPV